MSTSNPFDEITDRLLRIENTLLDLKHSVTPRVEKEADNFITVKEAAAFLNLAVTTVYDLVYKSKISSYRRGKRLYFVKQELCEWIKSGRRQTIQETKADAASSLYQK